MNVVAWIAQQYAWERKLAQLRFEALRAKAEPEASRRGEAEPGVLPAAEPTPTAA
jgi:hypothetical protein